MRPPSQAMSEPGRIETWTSERAEVRLKRGSTWTTVAPRSFAFITLLIAAVPGLLHELRDPLHRPVQRLLLPAVGIGGTVLDAGDTGGIDQHAVGGRALRAEGPAVDRRCRVPLDVDDLLILHVD